MPEPTLSTYIVWPEPCVAVTASSPKAAALEAQNHLGGSRFLVANTAGQARRDYATARNLATTVDLAPEDLNLPKCRSCGLPAPPGSLSRTCGAQTPIAAEDNSP